MSFRHLVHCLLSGQPYFGPALRASQGLIERHRCFWPIIEAIGAKDGTVNILEVGSWAGASAVTWARGLEAKGLQGKVLCVDSWIPYFNTIVDTDRVYTEMNEAAASGDILKLFIHNIRASGVESRIEYRRGDSRSVLPVLASRSFDIVYLDGSHRYAEVKFDLTEAARLVIDGGIICGDDLELQRDELTEHEHSEALATSRDYVKSESNDCWYHPGVTEAVLERFGRVSAWNGFWAARKKDGGWAEVELNVGDSDIPRHLTAGHDLVDPEKNDTSETVGPRSVIHPVLVGRTEGYSIIRFGDRYFAAAKSLGPLTLFEEKIGERELGNLLLVGSSLQDVRTRAQKLDEATASIVASQVAETEAYNIVQAGDRYLAVAKSLGPIALFEEKIGERELGNLVLSGSSLEEVRRRAEELGHANARPTVAQFSETQAYNIVQAGDRYLAVAKSLGPIALFEEKIGERELGNLLIAGSSVEQVRARAQELEEATATSVTWLARVRRAGW